MEESDKQFFYSQYKQRAVLFQEQIREYVADELETFPENDCLKLEIIRFVSEGGKRLRTVLARVVAEYLGSNEDYTTAALDTFHKFLLSHDDVIDRDRLRWSKPTLHASLEKLSHGFGDIEHFGNSLAIVSGDLISTMSYRFILNSSLDDGVKVKLMKLICQAMYEVGWGWYDQFLMDYELLSSNKLSESRIRESVIWVTGKYTISFPIRFGYCLSGKEMPAGLEDVADLLGILFQTGDDLIGIFGNPEKSGKSNFGDIVQGKKTLPIWFAYEMGSEFEKKRLVELVGKKDISEAEVSEVRVIMKKNGSLSRTKEYMFDLSNEIVVKLNNISLPEGLRRFLKGFAAYLVDRDA